MKSGIVHTLLLALYPALFVFGQNADIVRFADIVAPAALILAGVAVVWLVSFVWLRSGVKASLLSSLFVFLFFSYGPIFSFGFTNKIPLLERHTFLLPLFILALLAGTVAILRAKGALENPTRLLNFFSVTLCAVTLAGLIPELLAPEPERARSEVDNVVLRPPNPAPDVYFLVLDAYARGDVLADMGYDNSEFLSFLADKGFFVADSSYANYSQTALALASILNLDYLDDTVSQLDTESTNRHPLAEMIRHSSVRRMLEESGYETEAIASGYWVTEMKDATLYHASKDAFAPSDLASLFLNMTPLPPLLKKVFQRRVGYDWHRDRVLGGFERLSASPATDAPRFFFAHFVTPHAPYIFTADGSFKPESRPFSMSWPKVDDEAKYLEQVGFVNRMLEQTIERILAESAVQPIIILQSDHGPRKVMDVPDNSAIERRMAILNAIYTGEATYPEFERDLSPVNTFRLIFDQHFGTNLGELPARSMFSNYDRPYLMDDVTDALGRSRSK